MQSSPYGARACARLSVSAYIDGSNLFHAGEKIGIRVDYAKLKPFIISSRTLIDLNFYDTTENKPAEVKFFARIHGLGYTLRIVKLHRYGCQTPEEKRIDTQIVADSLVDGLVNNKFDVALFATGDKDILPAMEYLLAAKKKVEVMSFDHSLAWDIKNSGAKIISLTRLANQIRRI
jgi:uncharacterized LabA/DUF88 family protein